MDHPMQIELLNGGTVDVAAVRQLIRRVADERKWAASLRLRVIAAFMALVDTLYIKESQQDAPLKVTMQVVKQAERELIEFHVDVLPGEIRRRFPVGHWRLKRVSDAMEIKSGTDYDHIVLKLWSNEDQPS
jgi:hypothetical protein